MQQPNKFEEAFEFEISAWCYGLKHYPGEIHRALVHKVIQEMSPVLFEAIYNNYIFDLVKVAQRFCQASKYLIAEVEVVYSMLARIPPPRLFKTEDQMYTVAAILDGVEKKYPGAIARVEERWAFQEAEGERIRKEKEERQSGIIDPFASPTKKAANLR